MSDNREADAHGWLELGAMVVGLVALAALGSWIDAQWIRMVVANG